jgi:transketolase
MGNRLSPAAKENLAAAALTVRALSADAVEKAQSGHPGLPLGCAELGALIYGEILKHNPADPQWINRDRFILSAGHGSMLLYSLLFLCGYDLSLADIKAFRQLGSKTPGHPERGATPGVETTTGPLGQGFGNAVGLAVAERMMASRFNTAKHPLIDHFTYALASDGDLMEGVCYEAASLAGHLKLGKLIVFYDSNSISIDGKTELAFSDDVPARFRACGWQVLQGDAYNLEGILELVDEVKQDAGRPGLIALRSQIGKGAPQLAGSHLAHGGAMGREEVEGLKHRLGIEGEFYVSAQAVKYFAQRREAWTETYQRWQALFGQWQRENPALYEQWCRLAGEQNGNPLELRLPDFQVGESIATRLAGGRILDALLLQRPELVGGSADLTVPCFGTTPQVPVFSAEDYSGRFLYFGVREHAMGTVSNGIALHGFLRPFCATFMAFSDYMRPAIRLAALIRLPVIYVMTHDSVKIGEDGPTHQPVEHLAAHGARPDPLSPECVPQRRSELAGNHTQGGLYRQRLRRRTRPGNHSHRLGSSGGSGGMRRGAGGQDPRGIHALPRAFSGTGGRVPRLVAAACSRQDRNRGRGGSGVAGVVLRGLFHPVHRPLWAFGAWSSGRLRPRHRYRFSPADGSIGDCPETAQPEVRSASSHLDSSPPAG